MNPNLESNIFNLIKNKYIYNEKYILCAAYLHNPSVIPEEYLIINSFVNKNFTTFTKKEMLSFLLSNFSAFKNKNNFFAFMNSKHKINTSILSEIPNIKEIKYKDPIWEGVLFIVPKNNLIHKIGIELFYDKYLNQQIINPFSTNPNLSFNITNTNHLFLNPYKSFMLNLQHKFILR